MTLIAQISDTHICAGSMDAAVRLDELARTVEAINGLRPRPVAVIHTGDLAQNGTAADYAAARAILSRLAMPFLPAVGNRDHREALHAAFLADLLPDRHGGFVQYAVDVGRVRIVVADTRDGASNLGAFCEARQSHLRRLLADQPDRITLIILHHPPVPIPALAKQPLQFRDEKHARELLVCLAGASQVAGVVTGHVHRSAFVPLGGTMLASMPSLATDLRREQLPDGFARTPIFRLLSVTGMRLSFASVAVR